MRFPEKFLQIAKISGVDQYIFIDNKGNIEAQSIKNSQKAAEMVFSCCKNIRAIGRNQFKYAVFSRKNKKNLILFPLGYYSLGVVKQKDIGTLVLVEIILESLQELLNTKDK